MSTEPMTFSAFTTTTLQPLESTSKKLEQTQILATALQNAQPEEIKDITLFVLGQLGPIYANPELNMGLELFLLACVRAATNATVTSNLFGESEADITADKSAKLAMKRRFKELGDAGVLAQELVIESPAQETSLNEVMDRLLTIAQTSGEGSQEAKIDQLAALLRSVDGLSRRFIARFVVGDTRLGVSDRTLLDAVSWMLTGDKSLRPRIDDVYQRRPDLPALVLAAKTGGIEAIEKLDAALGVPVLPALCDRLKTTQEMIDKMGEVFVEPKYDGTRLQIHWDAVTGFCKTFTRNMEENTWMFPELPGLLRELPVKSVIIDAEAVGYDPLTRELVNFQQTIKRKRKHDIDAFAEAIPLRFFVFDVLLLNGESLLRTPLQERRAKLLEVLKDARHDLELAPQIRTSSAEEIRQYHVDQLAAGLEGIIVKRVDGPYQSGRKAFNWVKLKEAEGTTAKLSDTIDAVVLGYYYGRGKRTEFGVGAFLVGVPDESGNSASRLLTLAKIGTGLSDDQWRELKQRCDVLIASGAGTAPESALLQPIIPEALMPDVMVPFSPRGLVVEIAADEVTRSPLHSAGVALRFPRLVRFRDDKLVNQATSVDEVRVIGNVFERSQESEKSQDTKDAENSTDSEKSELVN